MSVRHLAAVGDVQGLAPTCKLLLYGMALNADARGYSVTSIKTLIRSTGLSERSIRDNLTQLRKLGLVEKKSGAFHKLDLAALAVYNERLPQHDMAVDHDPGFATQ
jgi:hypothetical protein